MTEPGGDLEYGPIELPDPDPEPEPEERPEPNRGGRLNRRSFLRKFGRPAALLLGGSFLGFKAAEWWSTPVVDKDALEDAQEGEIGERYAAPFQGEDANQAAKQFEINAGIFLRTDPKDKYLTYVKDKIARESTDGVMAAETLLPIYPPEVHKYSEFLERHVREEPWTIDGKEFRIPANVLATLCTLESGGNAESTSPDGKVGLGQVLPEVHLDKIVDIARRTGTVPLDYAAIDPILGQWRRLVEHNEHEDAYNLLNNSPVKADIVRVLQDPFINSRVATLILKEYHSKALEKVGEEFWGRPLDPNHLSVWELALAAYNGGPDVIDTPFDELTEQTQNYMANARRLLLTGEVAAGVRNRDNGLASTANQLIAPEIDIRCNVFNELKKIYPALTGETGSERRNWLWNELASPDLQDEHATGDDADILNTARTLYRKFDKQRERDGTDNFSLPVSPGLRVWFATGGQSVLEQSPANKEPGNYFAKQ